MTKHHLAIPVGSFLLLFLSFRPCCAQTTPNPPPQTPQVAPPTGEAAKISDEELGRLYLVRKQYHEAQEIFRKLTVENPRSAIYWNELGISLHSQMELSTALKCYERSAKLDSKYADALNNMGTIYYGRKKYAKAVRSYNRAIALRADFPAFYLNLGYAYFGQKKYEESISAFRTALQLDPESLDAAKSRSGTVIQDRSLSADKAQFYFLLAKSFAESGNAERCALYLKKARDEGFKDLNSVNTDPSFAKVVKDPAVQEILSAKPPDTAQP